MCIIRPGPAPPPLPNTGGTTAPLSLWEIFRAGWHAIWDLAQVGNLFLQLEFVSNAMWFFFVSVNGGWSGWANSGSCSVTCGGGLQLQDRLCDDPAPQHGGLDCPGNGFQNITCNEHSCPRKLNKKTFYTFKVKRDLFVSAEWNTWQAWGSCSVTCNYGIRQRSRTCNPDGQCAGMGSYQDSEYCTLGSCPSGSSGSSKETLPCAIGAQVGGIAVLCSFQSYVYCS